MQKINLQDVTTLADDAEKVIPEAKHVAYNSCAGVSKSVITNCSPGVALQYLQVSFARVYAFAPVYAAHEPNYNKRDVSNQ